MPPPRSVGGGPSSSVTPAPAAVASLDDEDDEDGDKDEEAASGEEEELPQPPKKRKSAPASSRKAAKKPLVEVGRGGWKRPMGFFRPEARAPLLGTRSQISLCVQARATPPRWGREGVGRKTWQMALSVSLPLLPLPLLLSLLP